MSISDKVPQAIIAGGSSVALSQLFNLTPSGGCQTYLVVCGLDRNEYTADATGSTGSFAAHGARAGFTSIGGDGRGAGIVYTYQPTTGQYTNMTFGNLSQLAYTAATSPGDMTDISLFGTANQALANAYANNAYALIQTAALGFLGSATVETSRTPATPPSSATPNSIAATARTFVGHAWNMDGCWVLASTISAQAGAALPVQSTSVGTPGAANGEWSVLYNGPVAASGNWESLVSTGDVIVFANPGGASGHVTTCVGGSGSSAQIIDNIVYEDFSGTIVNSAHDGSSADILISAAHAASQEFSGVAANSVVIYALDTPAIVAPAAPIADTAGTRLALVNIVHAIDPANRTITSYQLYDSLAGASFSLASGSAATVQSAGAALSVNSLANLSLAYTQAGTDTLEVRAFNGSYWGDWQAIMVNVSVPKATAPCLTVQTPTQSWLAGGHIVDSIPANTFTDPQGQALTFQANLANGAALPGWLSFSASTDTFSGTAPLGSSTLAIKLTATDTSGLSAVEVFTASIAPAGVTGVKHGSLTQETTHQHILSLPHHFLH